jgi:lincosamide nucleotidyltransferase B/F
MTSDNYREFTERLRASLESKHDVLGLVALGSMAEIDYEPDHWSDHDFFVVVSPGEQERYRTNLNWLPDNDEVALSFRETEHGLKVLYRNGHLLEFAVFDLDELRLARINRFRVLIDRSNVMSALESVRTATVHAIDSGCKDDTYLVGMMLSSLIVGVGRFARGERLSGTRFVKGHALEHLLVLANRRNTVDRDAALDDLDPFRRFERAHPALARELGDALDLPTPDSARALLDVARREFGPLLDQIGSDAVAAVSKRISSASILL